jgi:hypothetical protein
VLGDETEKRLRMLLIKHAAAYHSASHVGVCSARPSSAVCKRCFVTGGCSSSRQTSSSICDKLSSDLARLFLKQACIACALRTCGHTPLACGDRNCAPLPCQRCLPRAHNTLNPSNFHQLSFHCSCAQLVLVRACSHCSSHAQATPACAADASSAHRCPHMRTYT